MRIFCATGRPFRRGTANGRSTRAVRVGGMPESLPLPAQRQLSAKRTSRCLSPPSILGVTLRARSGAKLLASQKDERTGANIEGGERDDAGAPVLRFSGRSETMRDPRKDVGMRPKGFGEGYSATPWHRSREDSGLAGTKCQ